MRDDERLREVGSFVLPEGDPAPETSVPVLGRVLSEVCALAGCPLADGYFQVLARAVDKQTVEVLVVLRLGRLPNDG